MKTEARIQQEIVQWFRNEYCRTVHQPQCMIFSVPNEGRNVKEQMRKLSTGMMSGVSDLIVMMQNRILFVEVKDETGKQSKNQILFQERARIMGFDYYLVRSLEEFKEIIQS